MEFVRRGFTLLTVFALMFALGCDGDSGPTGAQGPVGPQGEQGPEGSPGPGGEDGNANVTVHIFDGHDFTATSFVDLCFGTEISQQEMAKSSWDVYLAGDDAVFGLIYWHVPGFGSFGSSEYDVATAYDIQEFVCSAPQPFVDISLENGPGEIYEEIRIIQTVANNVSDNRSLVVDMSDYSTLIEYFGDAVNIVRH